MDVRIAYGIDIKEVPDKIAEMLNRFDTAQAADLVYLASQVLKLSSPQLAEPLLDQARIKLAELDKMLNDSQMILKGLINTLEAEEVQQPATPEVPNAD